MGPRATQHPDFINHYGLGRAPPSIPILLATMDAGFGFWGLDLGFQVSDFGFGFRILGFGGFSFQIPNAIDKLKIGALQRANSKLVNCLNDWLRVDAGGSGGLAPQQGRGVQLSSFI